MNSIRPIVLFLPMILFIMAAIGSLWDLDQFFDVAKAINDWILTTFSDVFAFAVLAFVLTCLGVFFSPLGKVRIGGKEAQPILGRWNWFAITLCTTIATGILFWATAEPIYHLYDSGNREILSGSQASREFAMVSLFMHWAFSPYAVYTVSALTFALVYHNLNKPNSLSGPLDVLVGRSTPQIISDILDALILLALILGMAASLGAGMLLLSGGIGNFIGTTTTPFVLGVIAISIMSVVLISSLTGLLRGIRILSDINMKFFILFLVFIFFCGPTLQIVVNALQAFGGYVIEFVPRSLVIGIANDQEWANTWTIFYWAIWLAWAPVSAMFLGRIAYGYSVREFIIMNLIVPAFFSIIWMSVLGGFAISIDQETGGSLKKVLDVAGPEAVAFEVISHLPFAAVISAVLLFLSFISYVTAADSNTEAIKMICFKHNDEQDGSIRNGALIKTVWVVLLGASAWIMVAFSGVDGVRMLSNVGGLPALFIVILLNITLIKLIFTHRQL